MIDTTTGRLPPKAQRTISDLAPLWAAAERRLGNAIEAESAAIDRARSLFSPPPKPWEGSAAAERWYEQSITIERAYAVPKFARRADAAATEFSALGRQIIERRPRNLAELAVKLRAILELEPFFENGDETNPVRQILADLESLAAAN
jgi:hypothetical protein